jgi:hypothetical protein
MTHSVTALQAQWTEVIGLRVVPQEVTGEMFVAWFGAAMTAWSPGSVAAVSATAPGSRMTVASPVGSMMVESPSAAMEVA